MAKISWVVETAVGTVTKDSPTISDANMQRFLDWVWYAYPQLEEDGTPKAKTNPNLAAAVRDWGSSQWQGTKANVLRYERNEAAQAARDAVTDVEV